jgi:hypothetical protein
MVEAAKRAAKEQGTISCACRGRGLSNIWTITKGGKSQRADPNDARPWIAFKSLAEGTKWKTLDDVDVVIVASVDDEEDPQNIEVFIFPANEVRKHFDAAYAARMQAGRVGGDFGMWVALHSSERGSRDMPLAIGSGIADKYKPIAVYSIEKLLTENAFGLATPSEDADEAEAFERAEAPEPRFTTIAQVMAWAREQVADIAGVRLEAVKLDLEY